MKPTMWLRRLLLGVLTVAILGSCYASAADDRYWVADMLSGKSILFVGDSMTSGYGLTDTALSWPKMLEQYGMDSTVISIAGSTVAAARGHTGTEDTDYTAGGCYYPMCQRPLPDGDYDVIFVNCGANDMNCEIPLADSISSRDIYTFQGAFNVLVDRLQEKYPNAVILAMTCWESSTDYRNSAGLNEDDYSQALMEVCEYRGIAYYNASDSSFSGIHAADEAFRSSFFLTSTDGYHLNERGQALFLPRIAGWIAAQLSS